MASMLRSLGFVRKLNQHGRMRLGSSSPSALLHPGRLQTTRTAAPSVAAAPGLGLDRRNYITGSAAAVEYSAGQQPEPRNAGGQRSSGNVDLMLRAIDARIKKYIVVHKRDVEEVLQAVMEKGSMTSTQALLMIRCCGEFLPTESFKARRQLLKDVWQTINELDVQLDVSHYNALLLVNLENEVDFSPLDFLLAMKQKNIEPNRVTFQRLIEQYCNKGDIAGATKILEHMSAQEIPINENIFNSLIRGHSEAGDVASAVKVLEIMAEAGIQPTSRTYTEILCTYAKRGDIEAIRQTLKEFKEKDIQMTDRELLEVVCSLAINNHLDLIDEIMALLVKGSIYNKEAMTSINRLIEKNQIEVAYKLLKSLVKTASMESSTSSNTGRFFIKKLVNSDVGEENIIKYCKILKEDGINDAPFETAVRAAFMSNLHHLAPALLKAWKDSGEVMREHYFYPLFVSYSKANNLQGILNTMKSMIYDYEILPSIITIKDYVIPFMVEDPASNASTLVVNSLPFQIAANSMVLHLLHENKINQAAKFMYSTTISYKTKLLVPPLLYAFEKTKDVDSYTDIVHLQYMNLLRDEQKNPEEEFADEKRISSKEFASMVLTKTVKMLSTHHGQAETVDNILRSWMNKGICINKEAVGTVKAYCGNLAPTSQDILAELASGTLEPTPINKDTVPRNLMSNTNASYRNIINLKSKAESSIEFKMLLIQQYAKMQNAEEVTRLLEELVAENPTYTVGLSATLVDFYSKTDDIESADRWFQRMLELNPEAKMDKAKILNYAIALIKSQRVEEAQKMLKFPKNDVEADKSTLCSKLLLVATTHCPEKAEEFFDLLQSEGYFDKVNIHILGPLVRGPIDADDVEKAIEKYKWACEKFRLAPHKQTLMKKLIKKEDPKSLQLVTDLTATIYGEVNALVDLAFAFFECERPRQARKILETEGIQLRKSKIMWMAQLYVDNDKPEMLTKLIDLLSGLYVDIDPLYVMLLQTYEKQGNWRECLALWTQMQEDNIQPSVTFMRHLEKILKEYNQNVPFTLPPSAHSQESTGSNFSDLSSANTMRLAEINALARSFHEALEAQDFTAAEKALRQIPKEQRSKLDWELIKSYESVNNMPKVLEVLSEMLYREPTINPMYFDTISRIIKQLVDTDDFPNIVKLGLHFEANMRLVHRHLRYHYDIILSEFYTKSVKWIDFLTRLEEHIDHPKAPRIINALIHPTSMVRAMRAQPEVEERFSEFAYKSFEQGINLPINLLWGYKFAKGSPDAEGIYKEHIATCSNFHNINALHVCKEFKAWDKLPLLAEKIAHAEQLSKNLKFKSFGAIISVLFECEAPNKYELAFECLRQATKVIPIEKFSQHTLTTIEQNLPSGQTIASITADKERVQEEATG